MSTNAYVGMELPDGKIKFVYLHWDGYVEKPGAGHKLKTFYKDVDKVEELINLGNISVLRENIGEKHDFDDNDLSSKNEWSVFSGRDRGEEDQEAEIVDNYESLPDDMGYVYIFKNDKWYYREGDSKLRKLLTKEDDIMDSEITIKFANEEQLKVFMKWFIDYGYDELCMNDSVCDDLSSEDFYDELNHISGGFKIT